MHDSKLRRVSVRMLTGVTSAALLALGVAVAAPAQASFAPCYIGGLSGSGTSADDPYLISSVEDLQSIDSGCADEMVYYALTADIALTSSDADLNEIGDNAWDIPSVFSGNFDGRGYTISGLNQDYEMGLFGSIVKRDDLADSGVVKNLNLAGANNSAGWSWNPYYDDGFSNVPNENVAVGALAGYAYGASIINVHSSVDVNADSYAGGLVGYAGTADGTSDNDQDWTTQIVRSSSSGNVVAGDDDGWDNGTGGLVGYSDWFNSIIASSFSGLVDTRDSDDTDYVGGLIGYSYANQVVNCSVSGNVTTDQGDDIGGLIGYVYDGTSIDGTTVSGTVTGDADYSNYVGGLVGYYYNSDYVGGVTNVSFTGASVTGADEVGGLFGYWDAGTDNAVLANSSATTNVYGNDYVGGIVGEVDDNGLFNNLTFIGNVTASSGGDKVGGIVGYVDYSADFTNLTVSGNISGDEYVGGVLGYTNASADYTFVNNASVTGNVSGTDSEIGGVIGYGYYIKVSNVSFSGNVSSTDDGYVGGVAGYLYDANLDHATAAGTVTATGTGDDYYVGGLAGFVEDTDVTYSLSTATVSASAPGTSDEFYDVGGLVGYAYDGTISNTAATGSVTSDGYYTGGLVGYVYYYENINNSFATGTVKAQNDAIGGLVGAVYGSGDYLQIANSYAANTVVDDSISGGKQVDPFITQYDSYWHDNNGTNVFLKASSDSSSQADVRGVTAAELKSASFLKGLGWKISSTGAAVKGNTWAISSAANHGLPYLIGLPTISGAGCTAKIKSVTFASGSSTLGAAAKYSLRSAAKAIKAGGCSTVALTGYKSTSGAGKTLAGKRLTAVRNYLAARTSGVTYTVTVKSSKTAAMRLKVTGKVS